MPIRTNRGRAAVYRRLWGWPLRSPKHLIGTLVFLAVLFTALGIVLPKVVGKAKATPGPAGTTTSVSTPHSPGIAAPVPATSTLPTRLSGPVTTPTTAPPNFDALRVAKEWANAWVNHPAGMTSEQWLNGLRPYTTEEFLAAKMASIDPANIPATKVTGEPVVGQSFADSVQLTITTDGPKLSITVVTTNAGWRVTAYDQAS
jgi:hypothetical protein